MARAIETNTTTDGHKAETDSGVAASSSPSGKPPHLQLVDGPVDPNARIGERMRAARLSKGLEIEDIARQLRLRQEYIYAMETMQVSRLPKGFVNPYIRDYARALDMNPAECVERFNEQCGVLAHSAPEQVTVPKSENKFIKPLIKLGLAALGIVVAGGLFFAGYKFITTPAETPVVAHTPSIPTNRDYREVGSRLPVTASPALSAAMNAFNLEIRADRRAWIEIRGADGTLFVDRQFSRGEVYDLRVGAGWTLTTQDAGAFSWVVDGEPLAPVGQTDQPLYTMDIDNAAAELRASLEMSAEDADRMAH